MSAGVDIGNSFAFERKWKRKRQMAAPDHRGRHLRVFRSEQAPGQIPEANAGRSVLTRHQVDRRVLASSIDLKVEFHPVALVQAVETRAFDCADVDERIGLAILASDEAEAFHRVEELDRAHGFLTGQRALRRFGGTAFHRDDVAHDLKVARRNLAAAIDQIELEFLVLGQTVESGTLDRADVDEHVFTAVIAADEAEALLDVEEFDLAAARADDLGGHAAATAAAATRGAAGTAAAAEAAPAAPAVAAAATATAAAKSGTATTAEPATAASTIAAAAESAAVAAEAATTAAAAAAAVRIKRFFTETVALIATSAAPSSIETHFPEHTLNSFMANLAGGTERLLPPRGMQSETGKRPNFAYAGGLITRKFRQGERIQAIARRPGGRVWHFSRESWWLASIPRLGQ